MKEHGILFKGEMVIAILNGAKSQTRRLIKGVPMHIHEGKCIMDWGLSAVYEQDGKFWLDVQTDVDDHSHDEIFPRYQVGDTLYVKETWCCKMDDGSHVPNGKGEWECHYAADGYAVQACDDEGFQRYNKNGYEASPWKSSLYMPKWAARVRLEVTAVRVQRLQKITEEDAIAEGIEPMPVKGTWKAYNCKWGWTVDPVRSYESLWQSIHDSKPKPSVGKRWQDNPWVWAYTFGRINAL